MRNNGVIRHVEFYDDYAIRFSVDVRTGKTEAIVTSAEFPNESKPYVPFEPVSARAIAKWNPADDFNPAFGYDLARTRALAKYYRKLSNIYKKGVRTWA